MRNEQLSSVLRTKVFFMDIKPLDYKKEAHASMPELVVVK